MYSVDVYRINGWKEKYYFNKYFELVKIKITDKHNRSKTMNETILYHGDKNEKIDERKNIENSLTLLQNLHENSNIIN